MRREEEEEVGKTSSPKRKVFHFQTPEQLIFISNFVRVSAEAARANFLNQKSFHQRGKEKEERRRRWNESPMYVNNKIQ
jgi:hypothetical protein